MTDEAPEFSSPFPKYDPKLLGGAVMAETPSQEVRRHAEQLGGLLANPALALQIGELFAANVSDPDEAARRRPFHISDYGDLWVVFSSHRQADDAPDPVKVVLRKSDGLVVTLLHHSEPLGKDEITGESRSIFPDLTPEERFERFLRPTESAPGFLMLLIAITNAGLLNKAELACQIGELFASGVYDEASMARQRPVEVRDDGDRWTVFGSHNRAMEDGEGPLKVVLRKWDGAVLELAIPRVPDDVGPGAAALSPESRLEAWLRPKTKAPAP